MKKEIEHKMGAKPVWKLMLTIGTPSTQLIAQFVC